MSFTRRTLFASGAAAAAVAASGLPTPAAAKAPLAGKQAAAFHRFKVGSFEVTAFHDGVVSNPRPKGFVRNASDDEVGAALAEVGLPADKLTISFTTLVVNTGDRLVAFDTGFRDNGTPTVGNMVPNMAAAGLDPKDVDTVLISHFHGDHISGIRAKDGAAVFANAELMVPEPEWAFWMDDARMNAAPEAARGGYMNARRVFNPVAKDVKRFAWGKELVPGITAIQADGHTPGHTAFLIASGNDRMMYLADTTNHPGIFARRPEWQAVFDADGNRAIETRKKLLDMASADKIRVSFYHAPFPATGFIVKDGAGYNFQAALWNNTL